MESISTKIFLFFFTFMTCCVCTQKARAAEGMFFDDLPAAFAQYDSLTNTWVFGNSRVQRTVHYDTAQKGLYCSSWKDMLTGLEVANTPSSEGRLVISHQKIDLGANFGLAAPSWEFGDNEEIKGGGVQTVQIHLAGVNANAGIRVSVCYDVYPGNEPWTTKWFKIDAPGLADSLLDTIVYDLFNADSLLSDTIGCGFQLKNHHFSPCAECHGHGLYIKLERLHMVSEWRIQYTDEAQCISGPIYDIDRRKHHKSLRGVWEHFTGDCQVYLSGVSCGPSHYGRTGFKRALS